MAITRYLRFDSFAEAFAGMSVIAIITDRLDHHPECINVHERVEIVLTVHDADGLSRRDAALAERIDDLDLLFGSDSPRPGAFPLQRRWVGESGRRRSFVRSIIQSTTAPDESR